MTADPRTALRKRLLAMRDELVAMMIRDGYSAGLGATLAGIAAALDALVTVTRSADAPPPPEGDRAAPCKGRSPKGCG